MPNPKRLSVFPRAKGGRFSPVPADQVVFIKGLLKASNGRASYPQIAAVVRQTGVSISSHAVQKIAVKNGLAHAGKTRAQGMYLVNGAKRAAISKYVRGKIAAAKLGEKMKFLFL